MTIDFGNSLLEIDRLVLIGIESDKKETKVKTGKFKYGLFTEYETKTTTTYNVVIDYILDGRSRKFTHTNYKSYADAEKTIDSVKSQIKEYGKNYIDNAFEQNVLKK